MTVEGEVLPRSGHTWVVQTKRGHQSFGYADDYADALHHVQDTSNLFREQGESVKSYTVFDPFDMPVLMFDEL